MLPNGRNGNGKVDVRWRDDANNETRFAVERRVGGTGAWAAIGETFANAGLYTDLTAAATTQYQYRVTARNAGYSSAPVASNAVTTPPANAGQLPYNPPRTPWTTETMIEAEAFDIGGEDVSSNDLSIGNAGGFYRSGNNDVGHNFTVGRYFVGWNRVGEWMEYAIDVPTAGTYVLEAAVASGDGLGGKFDLKVNGTPKASAVQIPYTGTFNLYEPVTSGTFTLAAGTNQVLRLTSVVDGASGWAVGDIDYFKLRLVDDGTGTLPVVTITATDPTATEAGTTSGTFTVMRSVVTDQPLTVPFVLAGSGQAIQDYADLQPRTVTIPAGLASAMITIQPVDDSLSEDDESIVATLSPDANVYTLGLPSSAVISLSDNDTVVGVDDCVSSITATAVNTSTIVVAWDAYPSGAALYEVYRSLQPDVPDTVQNRIASISGTTYSDATASANTRYFYSVVTIQGGGTRSFVSADATTTTRSNAQATALKASYVDEASVQLSWTDMSGNETGYVVQRLRTSDADWVNLATVASDEVQYVDESADSFEEVEYRVVATHMAETFQQSAASAPTTAHAPNVNRRGLILVFTGLGQQLKDVEGPVKLAQAIADDDASAAVTAGRTITYRIRVFKRGKIDEAVQYVQAYRNLGGRHLAMIGYSYGGGTVQQVAQRLADGNVTGPGGNRVRLEYTAYIDAIKNGTPGIAETRRPARSDFHVNFYNGAGITGQPMGAADIDNPDLDGDGDVDNDDQLISDAEAGTEVNHKTIDDVLLISQTIISGVQSQMPITVIGI